jgi:hypothetical protein
MPRFAVILHVRGPFKEASSADVYDGAYTCRFLSADNADGASAAAVEELRNEPRFQCFRTGSLDGSPRIEVDQVRAANLFEGRRGVPGYIFYDESSADAAKVKVLKPSASA